MSHPVRQRLVPTTLLALLIVALSACGGRVKGGIVLTSQDADFGTIANDAPVTRTFEIRNDGEGELEITGLTTSCSCTTAEVEDITVPPGSATTLIVTFDPRTHNGATGHFMRQVFITSNDPDAPRTTFTFRVEVVEA